MQGCRASDDDDTQVIALLHADILCHFQYHRVKIIKISEYIGYLQPQIF
jgi:hypothetical protein